VTLARGVQLPSSARAVGDTIEVGPAAQVANAAYNELVGPARVTGTRTSPLRLPILRIPSVASCDPGRTDVTVQPRQSRAIGPGRHGALTVRSQGTLTLAGGTYCVYSIHDPGRWAPAVHRPERGDRSW